MNKYDDKTLDVNLQVSRKMATIGNLAIRAATKKENIVQQSNVSLFEPGALSRVTRLAKQIAGNEIETGSKKEEGLQLEEIEIE